MAPFNWNNFKINNNNINNNNNNFSLQDIQNFGKYLGNLNINPQLMVTQILRGLNPIETQSIEKQATDIYNQLFKK